jgi:hypothetical protein
MPASAVHQAHAPLPAPKTAGTVINSAQRRSPIVLAEERASRKEAVNNGYIVIASALALLYERYVHHTLSGCTLTSCLEFGRARRRCDSLLCPVATAFDDTDPSRKLIVSSDLARLVKRVAQDMKITNYTTGVSPIVFFIRRDRKEIRFAQPVYKALGYPTKSRTRCWLIDWAQLAIELQVLSAHVEFRVRSTQQRYQRWVKTQGDTKRQALAILRRLALTRGISISSDVGSYTVHQMQQWARLNNFGSLFDAEIDRVRYRVASDLNRGNGTA